ncbi:DUF3955 domain-containing protein [Bacillus toyonensis]|uniref:DUF3955 domain-containing protein n=1 Tax=Bacillus toyonensis TaxID=155322 RepID=UPI003D64E0B3
MKERVHHEKIYLLAFISILLGSIHMVSYFMMGSIIEINGKITEPFSLIPLSILFVFSGIVTLLLMVEQVHHFQISILQNH